jgi:hypothetical protein
MALKQRPRTAWRLGQGGAIYHAENWSIIRDYPRSSSIHCLWLGDVERKWNDAFARSRYSICLFSRLIEPSAPAAARVHTCTGSRKCYGYRLAKARARACHPDDTFLEVPPTLFWQTKTMASPFFRRQVLLDTRRRLDQFECPLGRRRARFL